MLNKKKCVILQFVILNQIIHNKKYIKMLKKVSRIAAMFCLLAFAGNSYAQTVEEPVYPQYGFWSNWGIGVNGSFNFQPDVKAFFGNESYKWGEGYNAGFGLLLQKEIDRGAWLRLHWNMTDLANCDRDTTATLGEAGNNWGVGNKEATMDKHMALTAEYVLSLNNSFHNWKPETRGNLYVFAGGGVFWSMNNSRGVDNLGVQIDGGLGFSYRVCERSILFCELEADFLTNIPAPWASPYGWHHTNLLASVGYIYNLGVTAADKELIAQRALITKEALDALEEENDALKKEVATVKDDAKKLKDQIDDLTNENNRIRQESLARAQRVSDSLNGVLDQLKNDQLTYYAIPFSVLYPNDGWHVTDSEMIKVKAVCRIMKDNPDVKITVVGFCDYTASDAYNMKLSQRRAEEVKRLMVKKYGIDADRISCDWKGKTVAFGDIKYELNRRVSFYRVIE